jgi:hypothetical protein
VTDSQAGIAGLADGHHDEVKHALPGAGNSSFESSRVTISLAGYMSDDVTVIVSLAVTCRFNRRLLDCSDSNPSLGDTRATGVPLRQCAGLRA